LVIDRSGNPWAIQDFSKNVYKVSAVTGGLTTFPVPGQPIALAADAASVYVLTRP
jgi:hypothetical protein